MHFLRQSPRSAATFPPPFFAHLFSSMHAASGKMQNKHHRLQRRLFPPLTSGEEKTFVMFVQKRRKEKTFLSLSLALFGTFDHCKTDRTAVHSCLESRIWLGFA